MLGFHDELGVGGGKIHKERGVHSLGLVRCIQPGVCGTRCDRNVSPEMESEPEPHRTWCADAASARLCVMGVRKQMYRYVGQEMQMHGWLDMVEQCLMATD